MHEEASIFKAAFEWFKDNFEWFSWLAGGIAYMLYRVHRYFSGLNRVADEVAKLTDEDHGVMMKRDVLQTIQPVLEHIAVTNERLKSANDRLDRIEDRLNNRSKNERHDDA